MPKSAIVTTSSGREFKGILAYQDPFTIAIKDTDGWYHSWPAEEIKVQIRNPIAAHLELLSNYKNADVHNVFAYLETLK